MTAVKTNEIFSSSKIFVLAVLVFLRDETKLKIGKKMLITALISLVVWAIAFVLIKENVYSFREGIGTRV